MNKSLIVIILFITAACQSNKSKPNKEYQKNWKTNNLKGKVKSIIEFNYKQNVPDSELNYVVTKEYFKFSTTGNVIEQTTFLQEESFQTRNVYQYDPAGNYTAFTAYEEDSTFRYTDTYQFDAKGNLVVNEEINSSGKSKTKYSYNANGDCISMKTKWGLSESRYTYDSIGRRVSQENYTGDTIDSKIIYEYRGDTVQDISFDKGKFDSKQQIVNNKEGKMLWRKLTSDRTASDFEEFYRYDPSGNVIEYVKRRGPQFDTRYSYRCEYVYDKQGNWIKRTIYKIDGRPMSSVERKIAYF